MDATPAAAAAVKQEQDAAGSSQAEAVSPMQVTSKQEPEVKQEPQEAAAAHASTTEAQEKQQNAPANAAAAAAEVKAEAGPSSSAAEGAGKEGAEAGPSSTPPPVDPEELLKEFFADVKDVDRDNEVNRIIWAFKLNPFEKLNLRFDATMEDVKKQFRKLSLMVHPDKCKHPQASTAFDLLGDAQKQLGDEEQRNFLTQVLDAARDEVRKERKKSTKHDSLVRLASMLNEAGRQGVEEAWEQSDEFHEQWKVKAREYLAKTEWRRRKTIKRLKDEVAKSEVELAEAKEKAKKQREKDKVWETTREDRVSTWRDFVHKKRSAPADGEDKAKPKKALGELKPPKLKASDEDKLYVSRNVTEQFRPEQQTVKQKPNQMKNPHGLVPRR